MLNLRITASTLLTSRTVHKANSIQCDSLSPLRARLGVLSFTLWKFSGRVTVSAVTESCILFVYYFERDLLNTAETPDVKSVLTLPAV